MYAMFLFFLFIIVIIIVAVISKAMGRSTTLAYKEASLLSKAEEKFFFALLKAMGDEFHIWGKIRLADIIKPDATTREEYFRAFNRIKAKHVDFALIDKDTLDIICAIELDDKSHNREDRMARDEFVDAALRAVGIPILHFKVRSFYDPRIIKAEISRLFECIKA